MASSEQQDILDGVVHIYECDEQHVSVLIMPTDGEVRENLPISIEDAESDTVYTTTTTDAYGMINTTLSLSSGTYVPIIKCGNNIKNIYEGGVVCHACSLTLTSDKDILSAADGDIATLTATLIGTESGYNGPLSGREVAFEIYQASDDTFIETLTATTNSSGVATVSYSSQGIGDISIVAKVGRLVSETFSVEDIPLYDDASSDKSQHFGASVILRSSGNIEVNYDSSNHHYILSRTASGDGLLPITSITGLNDFTMEFDAQVNYGDGLGIGVCVYSSSSNWGAMGTNNRTWTVGTKANGSYNYTTPSCSLSSNKWYHFKATITNNTLKVEIYDGNTLKCTQTKTYSSSWFGETTQYGFNYMWQSGKPVPIKNIKVKSL